IWFAFIASSKIVIEENTAPCEAGVNNTVSLHFCLGRSCVGQFVPPIANCCGPVSATVVSGLPKVIGDPCLAMLLIFKVTLSVRPTFTLPKFTLHGLTFSVSGTAVGVGVAVGVAVGVGVAPPEPNAITRL